MSALGHSRHSATQKIVSASPTACPRQPLFLSTRGTISAPRHFAGRKVSVVSFGLFGDQGVFRREATGAAQVVAGRFGSGPIDVQYNSKKGGSATIETLAMSLQAAANKLHAENDVLFLILTSHGTPAGLAVKAGRLTQMLTPSKLADMRGRACDTRWWSSQPAIPESLSLVSRTPICW